MGHCRLQWGIKAKNKEGKVVRYIKETGAACFGFLSGCERSRLMAKVGEPNEEGWTRFDNDSQYPITNKKDFPKHEPSTRSVEYMSYPLFHKATLHACWKGMEKQIGVAIKQFIQSVPQYQDVVYDFKPHKGYLTFPLDKQTDRQAMWHMLWTVRNICHHNNFANSFKRVWFEEELRNPAVIFVMMEDFLYNDKSRWGEAGWSFTGNVYGSGVYSDRISCEYFAKWYNAPLTGDNPAGYCGDESGSLAKKFGYTGGISWFFSDNTQPEAHLIRRLKKILGKETEITTQELLDAFNRIAQQ